jgi:hypothetical protein
LTLASSTTTTSTFAPRGSSDRKRSASIDAAVVFPLDGFPHTTTRHPLARARVDVVVVVVVSSVPAAPMDE